MIKLNDGRKELWQWDTGRTIVVDEPCDIMHFANLTYGTAITVEVLNGGAKIPDELLQSGADLICWCFIGTADVGYTKMTKTFTVNKKPKPSDYVFTPTEQITLDKLLKEIKEGVYDGATFFPDVSPEGIISWTNNRDLTNPSPVNIQGPRGNPGYTPQKDVDYFDGKDGVGIVSVEQTVTSNEDEGENIITVTKSDETTSTFVVKNGSRGQKGDKGESERVDYSLVANALKGSANGAAVALADVSPLEHTLKVKAKVLNMIPSLTSSVTNNGLTLSRNADGSMTIQGTRTNNTINTFFTVLDNRVTPLINLVAGVTYTFSGGTKTEQLIITYKTSSNATSSSYSTAGGGKTTLTWGEGYIFETINVRVVPTASDEDLSNGVTLYPMLSEGDYGFAPYVEDISTANVKRYGGNLIPRPYFRPEVYEQGGVTFTQYANGSIRVQGAPEADVYYYLAKTLNLVGGVTYTLIDNSSILALSLEYKDEKGGWKHSDLNGVHLKHSFTWNDAYTLVALYIRVPKGYAVDETIYPIICIGDGVEYEQYQEPTTYPINADGTVEGITSIYPTTTLVPDTAGVVLDVEYNRDINKAFAKLENMISTIATNI